MLLAPIAALNKETFGLFVPTLFPLLAASVSRRKALVTTCVATVLALAAHGLVRWICRDNPVSGTLNDLSAALGAYFRHWTYHRVEMTYGVIGPQGSFAGTLLLMALVVVRGWPACSQPVRRHLLLAAAINLPFYILFCYVGELRNLSLLYVGFTVLIAAGAVARRTEFGRATQNDVASSRTEPSMPPPPRLNASCSHRGWHPPAHAFTGP